MQITSVLRGALGVGGVALATLVGLIAWNGSGVVPSTAPAPANGSDSVERMNASGDPVGGAVNAPVLPDPAMPIAAAPVPAVPAAASTSNPVERVAARRRHYVRRASPRRRTRVVVPRRSRRGSAAIIGGSAAGGAAIGALAGGGKGAAIGALAGGAGGAVYDRATRKKKVVVRR
jgi:hypothetical protein